MNLPSRLVFPLALIALGCVLILTPVLTHAYMANKNQDRVLEFLKSHSDSRMVPGQLDSAWGSHEAQVTFIMAGMGSFGPGAILIGVGLWLAWLGRKEKPGIEPVAKLATSDPSQGITQSYRAG